MIIYIAEEIYSNGTPNNVIAGFSSYELAAKYHLETIVRYIITGWKLPHNVSQNYQAYIINDYINNNLYSDALQFFNKLNEKDRGYTEFLITKVEYNPPINLTNISKVDTSAAKTFSTSATPPHGTFSVNISIPTDSSAKTDPNELNKKYVPDFPGATCRGPSCTYKSNYAYADKPDGTFICGQCKAFGYEE